MLLRAAWLALGCVTLASAQEREAKQDFEQLVLDLSGQDVRRIAWAAHRTPDDARLGKPLRLALATVLEARSKDLPRGAWRCAAGAVLDAMIRTGATLSSKELAPWFDRRISEAIVLASRDVPRHAGLLLRVLDDRHRDAAWVAACNLLVRNQPSIAVPELTKRCRVELEVFVIEADSFHGSHWSSFGTGCGVSSPKRLEGWPPSVSYALLLGGGERHRFAPGPQHVRYARQKNSKVRFGRATNVRVDRVDYAFRSLRSLAGGEQGDPEGRKGVAPRLTSRVKENLVWHDAEQLRTAVVEVADGLRAEYRELLVRLARRKLVSPATARDAVLPIDLELSDRRDAGNRAERLPRINLSPSKPR